MKRIISSALVLFMLLAVLASCAGNGDSGTTSADQTTGTTSALTETQADQTQTATPVTSTPTATPVLPTIDTPTPVFPTIITPTPTETPATPTPTETPVTPTPTETPVTPTPTETPVTPTPTETPVTPTPTETPVTPTPTGPALLKGKSALFVGDMLTAGAAADDGQNRGWAEIIAENFELSGVKNAGNANASVSTAAGELLIEDQIKAEAGNSYDFVIIEGGVNDAGKVVNVGRIVPKSASETTAEDLDTTTFAGGFESLLAQAKATFPSASVGCVIACRMTSKTGCISDMSRFALVIRLACEKWGVPVLDLYGNEEFEEEYLPDKTTNVGKDKIVPKESGYQIYSSWLSAFMSEIYNVECTPVFKIAPGVCDVAEVLSGKKVVYYGDSICDKSSHDDPARTRYYSYAGRIDELYGTKCYNRAKSGASLSTVRKGNYIMSQTTADRNRKVAMIVLEGGVNDAWDVAPVGTMSDMTAEDFDVSKLDKSTMAGGLEEILYFLTTNHPEAVIVYMINFKLNNGTGKLNNMKDYVDMIKLLCDKWGVVYLDLYNDGWFNARFDIKSKTNSTDGVHPNAAGYDLLAPVLAEFMADAYVAAHPEKFK